MLPQKVIFSFLLSCFIILSNLVYAQPGWTIDLFGKEKKPEKYEEKLLPSEKTASKKFTVVRRFLQNGTSHYNFFFNANEKMKAILERAKISNKDDFSKLISFYPYSLENTASQKSDLDSIIYKCTAGILLHDLRTEWVDNFYFLIGKSYLLKKDYDSAALTFQFINYNLYPRKRKNDDDDRIVGSNEAGTGGVGAVSIANKEKRNLFQRTFTRPPSRNEALIWQARTFIEQNELSDAAGLISILQNDPNLPLRLKNDLEEITSYWFYNQNNFDSAAIHLEKGLSNADNKEDKSRWKFLLAQMYEQAGNYDKATEYYAKASSSTSDVIMDIYARLNSAKMMRNTNNTKELDNSIDKLLHMAKKDKYESFRDIIYYSAAQLTVQKTDTMGGISLFKKSIEKNTTNSIYKDKSFLQIANLAYNQRNYLVAASSYDSVTAIQNEAGVDSATVVARKETLARLVPKIQAVEREDSTQRIAAMPQVEREKFVKQLAKKYRKANGLKEVEEEEVNTPITFANKNGKVEDIFANNGSSNGQWYFYNPSSKAKGFNDFKNRWGKRTNTDNWRRKSSAPTITKATVKTNNADPDAPVDENEKEPIALKEQDFSYDGLMGGLPLTKELMDSSNQTIAKNLYDAAQIFQNELQDYNEAIRLYEDFLNRFKEHELLSDVYLGLSFCYGKLGNTSKAGLYKNLVTSKFANSKAAKIIANPTNGSSETAQKSEGVAKYERIYNMFIEGKFAEAIDAKKKADSTYKNTYWNPQLLYIESVYYIKERKDSNAILTLNNIVNLYPTSPLKEKAKTMIDVLGRRAAIEKYLTELEVTRVAEDKIIIADDRPVVKVAAPVVKATEPKIITPVLPKKVMSDSIQKPAIYVNKSFSLQPDGPHFVAMILDKVDAVYVTETKNAFDRFNKESMATIAVVIKKDTLSTEKSLLLFSSFETTEIAMKYFDKIKKAAPAELSWLQATKYSFIIISEENLQVLKTNKDLTGYKDLLIKNFGNKF
jgi:tetratricopeptide (TPR) repeat protein